MHGSDILVVGIMGVLFAGALILPAFDKEVRAQRRRETVLGGSVPPKR